MPIGHDIQVGLIADALKDTTPPRAGVVYRSLFRVVVFRGRNLPTPSSLRRAITPSPARAAGDRRLAGTADIAAGECACGKRRIRTPDVAYAGHARAQKISSHWLSSGQGRVRARYLAKA